MPLSYTQNWDGVTPPAIASGWNVDATWTTSASQSYSSPNSIAVVDNTSTFKWATYGTADSSNGVIATISSYFLMPSSVTASAWQYGLTYRCSAGTMNNASTRCYVVRIQENPATGVASIALGTITNGTFASIVSVSLGGTAFAGQGWHYLEARANSNAHTVSCQNVASGWWLNSGGTFAAPSVACISTTDATYSTGDYSGLFARCPSNSISIYFDNFSISSQAPNQVIPHPLYVPVPRKFYTEDWG